MFTAILGFLLSENWARPRIENMRFTRKHRLLARLEGETGFKKFLATETELIWNVHGIAKVAELDGDELGYLLGKVAEIKRMK